MRIVNYLFSEFSVKGMQYLKGPIARWIVSYMGWQYLKGPIANVSYMGWQYLKGPIAKVVDGGWLLWLTSSGLISSVRLGLRRIRLAAVWQGSISLFVRNSNGSSSSQQQAYLRNRRTYTNKLGRPRTYSTSRRQNLSQHLAISGSRAQNMV